MGSQIWAVFVLSRHLQAHTTHNMNAYKLLLIVAVGAASGARQLRGMKDRDQRSLVNTFPFNAADGGHHGDHHAHGDDHGHHGDHAAFFTVAMTMSPRPAAGMRFRREPQPLT